MAQLIYCVKDIFTEYLKGEYKFFNIPEYQRGYKWSSTQIKQLLKDINDFNSNSNDDKFYCIQNITIVDNIQKKCFNVVDGQQRLTTLLVLLSYLDQSDLVKDKLKYSVRPETDKFIEHFILKKDIEKYTEWSPFIKSTDKSTVIDDYDHQDIFYLFSAYNTIKKWFDEESVENDLFKDKLLNKVKLIVNNPNTKNEQELFVNLNTGMVSLDGADLIRALLITNVAKEELANYDLNEVKTIVRINERRVRIGLELDEISTWWNQKNVIEYFSSLKKINVSSSETIDFDSTKYPINLLYKLFVSKRDKKEIKLSDFEVDNFINLYNELITLHRTIKDWFQDYEIYHFVGFLLFQTTIIFDEIWELWEKAKNRNDFITSLKEKIYKSLKNDEIEKLQDTTIDWFSNDDLYKILILLDIIQIVSSQGKNKLSFLDARYFKPRSEDREHIFPQTPIGNNNCGIDVMKKYLDILRDAGIEINLEEDKWEDANYQESFANEINNQLTKEIHINSIGNLCLLHEKVNRGYGNDFYSEKRFIIIQNVKKGEYIRPHTLNAFDKGFDEKSKNMDNWTHDDIKNNALYIQNQINDFFTNIVNHNENK